MMTTMENSKYEELCRLCATKTTMVLAINIFENEGAIRQISKKIDTCLPVKVHQTDELPKMICENCLYKLELLCDFRERSARTEKLLLELFKELASNRPQNQTSCMVSIDNELIMVQHHQLLTDQNLQNVSEIDITHLGQREGLIVDHEIILTQQHVDMNSHSLDSIDLNNHALSQDHSNQAQDTTMVEASQGIQDVRFVENINLMQHQLLTDQFRLQQELQLNITDDSGNDISLQNNLKDNSHQNNSKYHHPTGKLDDCSDICDIDYEDSKIISNNLPVESSLTEISSQGSYPSKKIRYKIEQLKQEDSNSGHSLHIDERLDITDRQIYNLSVENGDSIVMLDTGSKHWFYCNLCGKSYEDKSIFEEHYEKHFYKCDICMALFTNIDILNTHRKEVHGTNTITNESKIVPRPSKKSSEQIKSENGLKTESETSEPECDTGQCEDEEEEEMTNSIDTEDNKKKTWSPKVCKECGKAYKSNYKLAEHMRKHTGEKPYKCKSCEKAFRSKIGLAQHEAKHTGQYDFSCPTCGKGFQCKSYLMVHQRVHSNIKPYPCTTCGQNFKTKQSLLDHTNRHLGVKPYMCDVCGRGFITKALCRAHQKIHSGLDNRKYSCKICSKMFVSKSYLQTHLRIHTGEKPFKCEVCTKAFLTRVDLRIHSTLHTGEKSYVCEMCGKAFARRDALRCHRRLHTGERPYSCEICGQTFTQFTPMAIHKRLHTGERPYTCETCGKTFVSRSTMMAHAKKHLR